MITFRDWTDKDQETLDSLRESGNLMREDKLGEIELNLPDRYEHYELWYWAGIGVVLQSEVGGQNLDPQVVMGSDDIVEIMIEIRTLENQ